MNEPRGKSPLAASSAAHVSSVMETVRLMDLDSWVGFRPAPSRFPPRVGGLGFRFMRGR
jgi:hypothetical protein